MDFIIKDLVNEEIVHMELAYKFYLYDPTLSDDQLLNWIGPNRNDSLNLKLDKLKSKQFPLINHPSIAKLLSGLNVETISQSLCFMASLYLPYQSDIQIKRSFREAIQGFYLDFNSFALWNHCNKEYYIPSKTEWGNDPSTAAHWSSYAPLTSSIKASMEERRSIMCWQKQDDLYQSFFIVWW